MSRAHLLTSTRLLTCLATALCLFQAAGAQTTTYTYDALGRLTGSSPTGGSNQQPTSTVFDAAGNRVSYSVGGGGATPTPPTPPTPPTATGDSVAMRCNLTMDVNLTANDSDAANNYPLTLVSIDQVAGSMDGDATIVSGSTVSVTAGPSIGTQQFYDYVVSNSVGLTSGGVLSVNVTGPAHFCS